MTESKLAEINGMAEEAKRRALNIWRKPTANRVDALIIAIDRLRDAAIAGVPDPAVHPAVPSLELHAAEAGSSGAVNSGSEHPSGTALETHAAFLAGPALLAEVEAVAAKIGANDVVSGSPGPLFSMGWGCATKAAARMLRKHFAGGAR